jgi:hypothetical protein
MWPQCREASDSLVFVTKLSAESAGLDRDTGVDLPKANVSSVPPP